MNHRFGGSLLAACLLAGCAVPVAPRTTDDAGAIAPRYTALAANATPVAIADVSASSASTAIATSSDRDDRWFAFGHLTDGNLHSAWSPSEDDANPTITMSLVAASAVSGLGIKMDAGATFDVAVDAGSGWTTVATGVTPTYGALDFVSLDVASARRVRLTFHRAASSPLLVCDVRLFTGGATATPTPAPSTTPGSTDCLTLSGSGEVNVIDRPTNRLIDGGRFYFQDVTVSAGVASGIFLLASEQGDWRDDFMVEAVTRTDELVTVTGTSLDGATRATIEVRLIHTTSGALQGVPSRVTVVSLATGETLRSQVFPAADTLTTLFQLDVELGTCALPSAAPPPTECVSVTAEQGGSEEIARETAYPNLYAFYGVRATPSGYVGTFINDGASLEVPTYRVTAIQTAGDTVVITGVPIPDLDRLGNPGVPGPYVSVKETLTITRNDGGGFVGYVSKSERTSFDGTVRTLTFDATTPYAGGMHSNVTLSGAIGACLTY